MKVELALDEALALVVIIRMHMNLLPLERGSASTALILLDRLERAVLEDRVGFAN